MAKQSKEEAVQWYAQNRGLYKKLSAKINNILLELLEEEGLTVHAITNRTKDVDSFKNKIDGPKYEDPISQITDLSGIRIIAYVEDDLQPICSIIENAFHIDSDNSLNKSDELGTDKVGYRSIHYIGRIKEDRLGLTEYKKFENLKFEIQVRTILQHAWAEIEHDKNYKFNGVLPTEIKRRFKILAGTLELVDREFNLLSQEIDKISQSVITATIENELSNVKISSTTLKKYLKNKFSKLLPANIEPHFNYHDNDIIQELSKFGINNLKELDSVIPKNFEENIIKFNELQEMSNFLGHLRSVLMIKDYKKYFSQSWNNDWKGISEDTISLLEHYKIDTKDMIDRYDLR